MICDNKIKKMYTQEEYLQIFVKLYCDDCQVLVSTASTTGLASISIPWLYQPLHHAWTPYVQIKSK